MSSQMFLGVLTVVLACIAAVMGANDEPPTISCSFTASIKSRVVLPDGSMQVTNYEHYSVAKKKFLQSGLIADWFPRNMTALFINPNKYTYIQPFFDRKICATIPFRSIIPCFHMAQNCTKTASRVPCPSDPSLMCDTWQYQDTEVWFLRSDTDPVILDEIIIKDPQLKMKATSLFLKFDPTAPDPSVFTIPADQPCANLINDKSDLYPEENDVEMKPQRRIDLLLPFQFAQNSPYSREAIQHAAEKANRKPHKFSGQGKTVTVSVPQNTWRLGDEIPEEYDASVAHANCSVNTIVDQGSCSSSWAISAARTMSDRFCIASGKKMTFSPQWMVDCHNEQLECRGGFGDKAFQDLKKYGIVTEQCVPYTGQADQCPFSCRDGSQLTIYKLKSAYSPYKKNDTIATMQLIQQDILMNGPVTAGLWTFNDFREYQSGVYEHKSSTGVVAQHTVRIVGWGVDAASKKPYWKVANSWGESWGENGYFRILRGTNECAMEDQVASGAF